MGLPTEDVARTLASYVRSMLSGSAPFDRFVNGKRRALSAEQQAGLEVFRGKGNCTACHAGPTFSDERLHNTGRPSTTQRSPLKTMDNPVFIESGDKS